MTATTIPLDTVVESKTNPRKTYDKDALAELATSLGKHGVLQPILVRTLEGKGGTYEIVAGHRRFRAAKLAKLTEIPATVRELGDQEVLEIQVVENLQRVDLHPLEEAEGYRRLIKEFGYRAEDLGDKVGKSRAYIYARMKLADLPKAAKQAFRDGKLTSSIALLFARIPDKKLAEKAVAEVIDDPEELTFRQVKEWLARDYMRTLKAAPFDTADPELLPAVGSCTDCPKRTGSQPDLFGDVSADVCTEPGCFRDKVAAGFDVRVREVEAAGGRRATKAEQKKAGGGSNYLSSYGLESCGLLELDRECWEAPRAKTYRALLGKKRLQDLPVVVVEHPGTGEAVDCADKYAVTKLLRDNFAWAKPQKKKQPAWAAEDKRRAEETKIRREVHREAIDELVVWCEGFKMSAELGELVKTIADAFVGQTWSDCVGKVAARRDLPVDKRKGASAALKAALVDSKGAEALGLLVELVASRAGDHDVAMGKKPTTAGPFYTLAGFDYAAAEKAVRARVKKAAKKKPTKKKAAKKKPTKKKAAKKKAAKKKAAKKKGA